MRSFNKGAAVLVSCFVLGLVLLAPAIVHGDDWNLATRFTINQPFEVPGTVLQPNTSYVIRLLDSPAERHVVQIFNDDESKLLAMFMAISDQRMEPTDKTVFNFMETAPGYPVPIKEWFYPGRLRGLEFVYPKEQRLEISRHGRESVQTASVITTKSENNVVLEEKPSVAESTPSVEKTEEESVQIAQNDNTSTLKSEPEEVQREKPAEETQAVTEEKKTEPAKTEELPRTAGELPLIALIGALCVASGLGLKALSSKS